MRKLVRRGWIAGLVLQATVLLPACTLMRDLGFGGSGNSRDNPPSNVGAPNGEGPGASGSGIADLSEEERRKVLQTVLKITRPMSSASRSFRHSKGRWPANFEELSTFQPTLLTTIDPDVVQDLVFSSVSENESLTIKFNVVDPERGVRHLQGFRVDP